MRGTDWMILLAVGAGLWITSRRQSSYADPGRGATTGSGEGEASRQYDPSLMRMQLSLLQAKGRDITEAVKASPAAGLALGLEPQQIDFLRLPDEKYQNLYAFNPPPPSST